LTSADYSSAGVFNRPHSYTFLLTGKPFKVDGFIRLIMTDGKVSQGFVVADFAQILNQIK
jgi:hypothetical protein